MRGECEGWGKRVGERGQNELLGRGEKRKKENNNRSNSKNRKPTIIKLTTTKNPKKSMGKDEQTNKKQRQTNKQKISRFKNNRISVLVSVLVLLLQHTVLVLVFKQKLCCSLTRWLACG
jgi:hypothetical protein